MQPNKHQKTKVQESPFLFDDAQHVDLKQRKGESVSRQRRSASKHVEGCTLTTPSSRYHLPHGFENANKSLPQMSSSFIQGPCSKMSKVHAQNISTALRG